MIPRLLTIILVLAIDALFDLPSVSLATPIYRGQQLMQEHVVEVTGRVVDSTDGKGVPASVTVGAGAIAVMDLISDGLPVPHTLAVAEADESGEFSLKARVPRAARAHLEVRSEGYVPYTVPVDVDGQKMDAGAVLLRPCGTVHLVIKYYNENIIHPKFMGIYFESMATGERIELGGLRCDAGSLREATLADYLIHDIPIGQWEIKCEYFRFSEASLRGRISVLRSQESFIEVAVTNCIPAKRDVELRGRISGQFQVCTLLQGVSLATRMGTTIKGRQLEGGSWAFWSVDCDELPARILVNDSRFELESSGSVVYSGGQLNFDLRGTGGLRVTCIDGDGQRIDEDVAVFYRGIDTWSVVPALVPLKLIGDGQDAQSVIRGLPLIGEALLIQVVVPGFARSSTIVNTTNISPGVVVDVDVTMQRKCDFEILLDREILKAEAEAVRAVQILTVSDSATSEPRIVRNYFGEREVSGERVLFLDLAPGEYEFEAIKYGIAISDVSSRVSIGNSSRTDPVTLRISRAARLWKPVKGKSG